MMKTKKWLVAAIAAVSLTAVAGTSAFALQDGGSGGSGGSGGDSGDIFENPVTGGDASPNNAGACGEEGQTVPVGILSIGTGNSEASTRCRGFSGRGGNARFTARTGNGGRGGAGGSGGGGGNRTTIRRSGGGGFFDF